MLRCSGWWCLSGGCEAPGSGYLMWYWPSGYLMDRILCGEVCFYQGMLIQRQSYRGDYAYPCGGATVSVGDGMDSMLPGARGCLWYCLIMSGTQCCYLAPVRPYQISPVLKALGCGCWRPGCTPIRAKRGDPYWADMWWNTVSTRLSW
jgi:hypothetical protein